jgi:hypothetical protein
MSETAKFTPNLKENYRDESYRVIAVDDQNLVVRGTVTGNVFTIANATPDFPLTTEEYPIGQLIGLSIPKTELPN